MGVTRGWVVGERCGQRAQTSSQDMSKSGRSNMWHSDYSYTILYTGKLLNRKCSHHKCDVMQVLANATVVIILHYVSNRHLKLTQCYVSLRSQ